MKRLIFVPLAKAQANISISAAALALLAALCLTAGCTQHRVQVDPIKSQHEVTVKPMEMTINVNVKVQVDRALDDFFEDIDQTEEKLETQ